jgi:hypothetical protein
MAQSSEGFRKLLETDRDVAYDIAGMKMSEFTPDNLVVKSAMQQTGMSFEELKKAKMESAIGSIDMTGRLDAKIANAKNILKENPKMTMQQLVQLPEFGSVVASARQVGVASGMSVTDTASMVAAMMNLPESQRADFTKEMEKALGKTSGKGRVGEITEAGDAAGLAAMSESIQNMSGEFEKAGKAASQMTASFLDAMLKFQEAIKSGDNQAVLGAFQQMQQPQSGTAKQ